MLMNLGEIVLSLLMILLAVIKLDPFGWSMPTNMQMLVLGLLIAAFGFYSGLLYRERARDERDGLHLYRASRFGYIAGITALVAAIVVQSLQGALDPWVVVVLCVMIVAKLVSRMLERYYH